MKMLNCVMKKEIKQPTTRKNKEFRLYFNSVLNKYKILAVNNPKKKDQSAIGSLLINHSKIRDRSKILLKMPLNNDKRNDPFI